VAKTTAEVRKIQMEYSFDRLGVSKIIQAYQFLVPDKSWPTGEMNECIEPQERDQVYEDSSHLCESVLGAAERRMNYR